MQITDFIVHLLEKQVDSSHASVVLRQKSIEQTLQLETFLDLLNKTFNAKANKSYSGFLSSAKNSESDDESYTKFQTLLNQFIGNECSFIEFSHQAMSYLQQHIEQANKATGGYIVFVNYQLFGNQYILVAMLNHTFGLSIDNDLKINPVDYLDINKLHLAARIDISQWQEESDSNRYIVMVRTKESHKLSDYFRQFIGSNEGIDSKKETTELLTAVNQFCEKEFEHNQEKNEFKQKAVDYCNEQADKGQNVILKDFSNYVSEGVVDDFLNYVNGEQFILSNEISPNKSVIRRFNKYSGRNESLSITISEQALGESVIFDEEKEVLVIKEIPATLKAQLMNRQLN